MEQASLPVLAAWESFYIIVGTSAAVLTGLQFVVIVLGAEMNKGTVETNRAFGTPTIVHFCTVLLIAALLSVPWHELFGVAFAFGLCGIVGLAYMALVIRIVRRQTSYTLVLEDWICHFILPPIAYATLLVTATLLQGRPVGSLFVIGAVALLLLFVGIHNSWDSATYIALNLRQQDEQADQE